MLILQTVLISCISTPTASELNWISPPDPDREGETIVTYDVNSNLVSMPLYYWLELVEYIADTETNKELLQVK